jgi:DNA-binding beta-propeller fold protein YncE
MHQLAITRRDALKVVVVALMPARTLAAASVSTLIGTGTAGYSHKQVNNPYGLVIGRDGALYFCDLDNQRIRGLDLKTHEVIDIAGNGQRGYAGDGGTATAAALNMPHEIAFDRRGNMYIAERDNHVVRKVDGATRIISTLAGTGAAGFSGDGGPASRAELRQPHSIAIAQDGRVLICDVGNHRIRAVDLTTGVIDTIGGTGERLPTPDGAPLRGTPLNGPRTMVVDRDGTIYLALREGNALYRIAPNTHTLHHLAGTGEQGYAGDGGPARQAKLAGPKGLALAGGALYLADTENHVIRRVDLASGVITTVLGTGARGDGPETAPLECKLSRPHGLFASNARTLYVSDSESHRIRVLGDSQK